MYAYSLEIWASSTILLWRRSKKKTAPRILSKVSAGFGCFEQWMHWTILNSPFVLHDYLPSRALHTPVYVFKSLLTYMQTVCHAREVEPAYELLMSFCSLSICTCMFI